MVELNNKKILVAFLMHLGDLTLVTPFIHVLRKAAPNSHISMLVDEKLKDVVFCNPNLNQVITIDKKGKDNTILSLMRCAKELSVKDFDIVINLHPNERCSFICALTRAKLRIGAAHMLFGWRWNVHLKLNRTLHAADMYIDILKRFGVKDLRNNGLEIFPSSEHFIKAEEFWHLQNIKNEDKLIGFNIGSAVITKRWSSERFAKCADILADKGYKIVFFGADTDKDMVKEAIGYMRAKAINAAGCFSIGSLAAAMRRCALIVTNDSGPMHVAISQKTPIVALYGPSNVRLYGPYTKNAIVVKANPECRGCDKAMRHKCDDMQCMTRLSVEQAIAAVEKIIIKVEKCQIR
jgi:heptosyltransferase-2